MPSVMSLTAVAPPCVVARAAVSLAVVPVWAVLSVGKFSKAVTSNE
jgi:hypothetical protein